MFDYWLCGWRVLSELAIPELLAWEGEDKPPDVTILLGQLPAGVVDPIFVSPKVRVGRAKDILFDFGEVRVYLSADGTHIIIDFKELVDTITVREFLLGGVFGCLCYLRGYMPLHACCLRIGESVVAFAGPRKVGKSTLAMSLRQMGATVLSDDVAVLEMTQQGPLVWPAFPCIKLWEGSVEHYGIDTRGLPLLFSDKYLVPINSSFKRDSLYLNTIFLLEEGGMAGDLAQVPTLLAVHGLQNNLYKPRMAQRLMGENGVFQQVTNLAFRVPVYRLQRGGNCDEIRLCAERIYPWLHTKKD